MKSKTMWVIFVGPQQHGSPGTRYVAKSGKVTELKSQAAKFQYRDWAENFAKTSGISLTEGIYEIGQEEFTDFESQMGDS